MTQVTNPDPDADPSLGGGGLGCLTTAIIAVVITQVVYAFLWFK
jgi:hypothetical protein